MAVSREIKTMLVCYTQIAFDKLLFYPSTNVSQNFGLIQNQENPQKNEELLFAQAVARTAIQLTKALTIAGVTAEEVKVPQTGYTTREIARAAFAWRMLDLTESNGVKIDAVVCLDFPSWSLIHSHKICWLSRTPDFISRDDFKVKHIDPNRADQDSNSFTRDGRLRVSDLNCSSVPALLKAEENGLREAVLILADDRRAAQEMARSGFKVEYNPFPLLLEADPSGPEWQNAVRRLVTRSARK